MKKIYPLLLVLFFYSCKKDKFPKEVYSGIVLHNVTKQPIPNQIVRMGIVSKTIGPKDSEFPGGRPVYTHLYLSANTDNNGKFSFEFPVEGDWIFAVQIQTGEYVQKIPAVNTVFTLDGPAILDLAKKHYDTLLVERPAYVRYQVKNINDSYTNDTLYASTYYRLHYITHGFDNSGISIITSNEYNMTFVGNTVDRVITDTIPGESEPTIPIIWKHTRSGTVIEKNETINLTLNTVRDYNIYY